MNKERFFNEIIEKVSDYYGEEATVSAHDVMKNNGLKKHGLCVTMGNSNCGPTIYLDEAYEEYNNGKSIEVLTDEIIKTFEEHTVKNKVDLGFFREFDRVRPNVCFKLISSKRNEELLEGVPYRMTADLAVVYFVSLRFMDIDGSILIRKEHMDLWEVSEEDLFEAALDNTPREFPVSLMPMGELLGNMMSDDEEVDMINDTGLYVVTNEKKINGAAVILYPGFLKEAGEFFGGGFYVLPSSVHELILIKESQSLAVSAMADIVKSVNRSCVSEEDFLSDSVYYYNPGDLGCENSVKKVEYASEAMLL